MIRIDAQSIGFPLVSVLIPAYNHASFVADAVRSVWAQDYPNLELIVIDDGSKDVTLEVLNQLSRQSPIPMRVIAQSNAGLNITLNRLVGEAGGEYLKFLASDDRLAEGVISEHVKVLRGSELTVGGCYGRLSYIGPDGAPIPMRAQPAKRSEDEFVEFLIGRSIPFSTICTTLKASVARENPFDAKLVWEDIDFFLRVLATHSMIRCDGVAAVYRVDDEGLNERIWYSDFEAQYDRIIGKVSTDRRVVAIGIRLVKAFGRARKAEAMARHRRVLPALKSLGAAVLLDPRIIFYYPHLIVRIVLGPGFRRRVTRLIRR